MSVVSEYFIMKWPMSWQLLHTLEIMLKDAANRLDPVEAGLPVQPEWATGTISCYQWQQGPPVLLLSLLVGRHVWQFQNSTSPYSQILAFARFPENLV